MKLCPKCRTYFEDSLLRFCANDGIPLAELDQTSELWTEGKEYIRETNKKIRREIRRSQIKKTLSILVTTVVVTSVMSVITLRSWIYTHPKETAEIRGEKTEETKIITQSTPKTQESPVIIESTPLISTPVREGLPKTDKPAIKITPKITEAPNTDETSAADENPSNKNQAAKTNTNSPANKNITLPPSDICAASDRIRFADEIKRSYSSFWKQKILSQKNILFEKYLKGNKSRDGAQLSVFQAGITVNIDSKCETATANVPIEWAVYSAEKAFSGGVKTIKGSESFLCRKGKIWSCR